LCLYDFKRIVTATPTSTGHETPMNVAKYLLLALLLLPLAELAAFVAVAVAIGFLWAVGLVLATSLVGALLLRHGGGSHIARVRTAWDQGSFNALQADSTGGTVLLAGILLLIPGFITDLAGLLLLLGPLRRTLNAALGRGAPPAPADGIVDLAPEQWHHVPDPALPKRDENERKS
jgi:UPF0716 protein FxsA